MEKNRKKGFGILLTVLGGGALAYWLWQMLWLALAVGGTMRGGEIFSVGIIGGADGPTAILVTAPPAFLQWLWPVLGALLLIGGILLIRQGRKGKEEKK